MGAFEWDFFIAHASADRAVAAELTSLLNGHDGARAFLDESSIEPGDDWQHRLVAALGSTRVVVVLVTPNTKDALYVREEIQRAITLVRDQRDRRLVPVYVDGALPAIHAPYGLGVFHAIGTGADGMESVARQLLAIRLSLIYAPPTQDSLASEQTTHPAQRRALIVDRSGANGAITSLVRAVEFARQGDTILLAPGRYDGPLTLVRNVEIIGVGDRSTIVIEASNSSTITSAADDVLLANLTIRQRGGSFPYQAVDIAGGRAVLDGCVLRGGTRSCLRVRGTAAPVVRSCSIEHTAEIGVEIGDDAEGRFERNLVRFHARFGAWIGGRSAPTFVGNTIDENTRHGIVVADEAHPVVDLNLIRRNGESGIHVAGRAAARIERNVIRLSSGPSISVTDDAECTAVWNVLERSSTHNLLCDSRGGIAVSDNLIRQAGGCGVLLRGPTAPDARRTELYGNEIVENAGHGIEVDGGREATITRNIVSDNSRNGLTVRNGAAATVTQNRIARNRRQGIRASGAAKARIEGNHIVGNGWQGVSVQASATEIVRNDLIRNKAGGAVFSQGADGEVAECNFEDFDGARGVQVDDARVAIVRNRFKGPGWAILQLAAGADVTLLRNVGTGVEHAIALDDQSAAEKVDIRQNSFEWTTAGAVAADDETARVLGESWRADMHSKGFSSYVADGAGAPSEFVHETKRERLITEGRTLLRAESDTWAQAPPGGG